MHKGANATQIMQHRCWWIRFLKFFKFIDEDEVVVKADPKETYDNSLVRFDGECVRCRCWIVKKVL